MNGADGGVRGGSRVPAKAVVAVDGAEVGEVPAKAEVAVDGAEVGDWDFLEGAG